MRRGEKMSPEQRALRSVKAKGNMRSVGHRVTPESKANLKRGSKKGLGSPSKERGNADRGRSTPTDGRQERAA